MRNIDILKAINNIDDKYIEEAMPSQYREEKKPTFNFKWLTSILCVLLVGVVGYKVVNNILVNKTDNAENETITSDTGTFYVEIDNLDKAKDLIGFSFNVPDLGHKMSYAVITGESVIDVDYLDDNDTSIISLRKEKGMYDPIKSGDYNTYGNQESINIEGNDVTIKNNDNQIAAEFTKDGYSYYLYSDDLSKDRAIEIITYIIEND